MVLVALMASLLTGSVGAAPASAASAAAVLPQLSISDASLVRAVSGDPTLTFDVTLSQPATKQVTVGYTTQEDWQPIFVPGDAVGVPSPQSTTGQYVTESQSLVIAKGKSEKSVTVTILDNAPTSIPLWFTVALSGPVNATLEDAYGSATLLPPSSLPGFSVGLGDESIREPATGSETADMTVGFSEPAPKKFTLTATTPTGASPDYVPGKVAVTVNAKATSAVVPITVLANPANRSSASIPVTLTTTLGSVTRGTGTLTARGDAIVASRPGRLPGPPRIALVGDSITAGYTDYLKPLLEAEGYAVFENGVPGAGLMDADQCHGGVAAGIIASEDPDVVVADSVGNFGGFPPCAGSPPVDTPAYFAAWQGAAVTNSSVFTSKGASLYWIIAPDSPLSPWGVRLVNTNAGYLAIAAHTPNVYAIDTWTPLGGTAPNLALRAPDTLHLSASGNQVVSSIITTSIPASAPAAPTTVMATAGNGSAVVSWSVPASHGSPITSYTVTAWDWTNAANGGQKVTGTGSPVTVTGLTNGDAYVFLVTATNGRGTGPYGVAAVTPTTVPDPPTAVTAVPGNGSATVGWTNPSANGSPITNYTVTATDVTDPANGGQTASGPAGPLTVGGLTNGDSYTFAVTATNSRGTGAASVPSNSAVPATVPNSPTAVTAVPGNGSATVGWTNPSANGSPISHYTVSAVDVTNPANGGQTVSGSAGPLTVSGLTNGDSYTFTVTATNSRGTGAVSLPSSSVLIPTVPDPPSEVLSAPDADNDPGTLAVYFYAGFDEGSPTTRYTATAIDLSNPTDPSNGLVVTGSTSPIDVTGLTPGDSYAFTVTATNALGTSQSSSASAGEAAPAGVPGLPTAVTAVAGNGSATVTWTNPSANGSPITSYTVTASDGSDPANGGQTASGPAGPLTVGGLTNGDGYTFTVTATNGVGPGAASAPSPVTVPASAPDPPVSVEAAPDATDDSGILQVTVTPGFDEGSAVTAYSVTAIDLSDPSDPSDGMVFTSATGSITATGLNPGDEYAFTATATNALGTSQPSAASSGVVAPGGSSVGAAVRALSSAAPAATATKSTGSRRPAQRRRDQRSHRG